MSISQEEKERRAQELVEAEAELAKYFINIDNGICPHCQAKIKKQEQVGRCVYARPCGHRLYQGYLKGYEPDDE